MKNAEELISVIVPVYNVKSFLPQCVDSVLNQTYKNIEIILVDDGSTDESGEICDKYSKLDKRVKTIHKANGGLSDARNVGIDNAKGKYFCFVDSDDIVDKNFVKSLYDAIVKTASDISICFFKKFFEEKELVEQTYNTEFVEMDKETLSFQLFEKDNIHFICACTKMYKKELFENLRFEVGRLHEDEFIVYKIFDKANKGVLVNSQLYFYRERPGSITKSLSFKEKNLDAFYSIESCYKFYKGTQYEQKALNRLINSTAYIYCTAKKRNAGKQILQFLIGEFKKYYKLNKAKTLKQRLFNMFPNIICKLKK